MFPFRHLVGFPNVPGVKMEDLADRRFIPDECSEVGDPFLDAATHTMMFTGENQTNADKEVVVRWMVIDFLESNFDEATKLARADSRKEFDLVTHNYMQFSRFANWKAAVQYLKAGGAFDEPLLIAALAVTTLMHIGVVLQDEVWATREGCQGVGCGIHVGKAINGSFFPLKKDYGSKVSLVQELVEKVIGKVAQEGTTAAVGEQMVVGGVPIDVITVPYEEAFSAKHRKCGSPRKVLSVTSMECAGVDETVGGLSPKGVLLSPVCASRSAPTVLPDVTKRVLHTRRVTSAKTESVASVPKPSEAPEPVCRMA